jgi:[ribosomal protein S5]-alanine N-acetyltransferase
MSDPFATSLPTLETERLALREIVEADVPALFEVFSDPQVMRYWSSPPLADLEGARKLAAEIAAGFRERRLFQWGITVKGEGRVVGTCTLFDWERPHRRAEIGFALHRAEQGRGIARESVSAVLSFGFGSLGIHRFEADVDPRNEACLRLLERLGFRREGYLRERYHVSGEVQDSVLLGLLEPEWRAGRPAGQGPGAA